MVVLDVVATRASLIFARVCTRTFSLASFNAFQNCRHNFFVRVKLPTLFDVKLHNLNLIIRSQQPHKAIYIRH
jgi:hypothetical protein